MKLEQYIEKENPIIIDMVCINEALKFKSTSDKRIQTSTSPVRDTYGNINTAGIGSNISLGGFFRSGLSGLGQGYSVEVNDFGQALSVSIKYCNTANGRVAGQNFVVVYNQFDVKQPYTTYSSYYRYRKCNDYNQAIQYMRSKANSLKGQTSGAL